MKKIAIVGAGVMGRTLALELVNNLSEFKLDLFDKDHTNGKKSCSYNAGGMIGPISELINHHEHVYELGCDSLKLWQQLLGSGRNIIEKFDTFLLAHRQDVAELDFAYKSIIFHTKLYPQALQKINSINHKSLLELEPAISNSTISERAYHIRDEGVINVVKFFEFTNNLFKTNSLVNFKTQKVNKIANKRVYVNKNTYYEYDEVYDCRGFLQEDSQEIYGVRGEAVVVQNQDIKLNSVIRLAHPRHSLYMIPRGSGIFYLGATSIASDRYSPISVQSIMELLSMALIIDKRFAEARIIKTLTAIRPTSLNDKPIIKETSDCVYINGLSRHGFLFAPKIAKDLIKRLKERL